MFRIHFPRLFWRSAKPVRNRRHESTSRKQRILSGLKWTPLPVSVGLSLIAYQKWQHIKRRPEVAGDLPPVWPNWKIRTYTALPLNAISRRFGWLADCSIPRLLRRPLFGFYCWLYDCRMEEALQPDLAEYPTFAQFFGRSLKPHIRPISVSELISPADGTLLQYGAVRDGKVEQVKGIDYDLEDFLGPYADLHTKKAIYACVVYLAPGDYHGFHSPANWTATMRRHFPGLLISVRHSVLLGVPRLFCLNERVALNGSWAHGFFSLTAVGATNVGNIALLPDPTLQTNAKKKVKVPEKSLSHQMKPGEKIGEFRLGSTIVLIFEAPDNFKFTAQPGGRLRFGQSLGILT